MNRYAVATYHAANFQDLADLTVPSKEAYCKLQGYDLHVVVDEEFARWRSLEIVSGLLSQGYDAVLYIDCDAIITSPHMRIEDLILFGEFLLTSDLYGLNMGVFCAQRTEGATKLLYAMMTEGANLTRGHFWCEQEAVMRFARFAPYDRVVKILPQRIMNSYSNIEHNRPPWIDSNWQPGDFILHMPALVNEDRFRVIEEASERTRTADERLFRVLMDRVEQEEPVRS